MSQYPPSQYPPQQYPPGQGPVPPMQPPGPPYGGQGGYPGGMPMAPKTSGAAIASLVCGILGCIPFITSLLAVILGIVGIKQTSNPQLTGRPLPIIGLLLGLLGIAGWKIGGG